MAPTPGRAAGLPDQLDGIRSFATERRPGFAECAPSGRLRLDAIACWLQDVAYADVADAGLDRVAVWVVRRTRIRVDRFPSLGASYGLRTFPSALGRMWAERRTDILSGGEPVVRALSLWVHLDPERWHPTPLTEAELTTYGGEGLPTGVSARLRHSAPHDGRDGARGWTFRATECDVAGHVNNAAYWQPLEEELLGAGDEPERIDVELEYRTPAQPGPKLVLADRDRRWILGPGGELHASFAISP
jgi:acyl-ACP thioesterase